MDQTPAKSFHTIGVVGKTRGNPNPASIKELVTLLRNSACKVIVENETAALIKGSGCATGNYSALASSCDLVVVMGGDGTLLNAARQLNNPAVPLLGVNQGRLGFLVDVSPSRLEQTIKEVLNGDYRCEERLLLTASVVRDDEVIATHRALNDVVIHTRDLPRMLEFDTYIDGGFISTHRADGFIVTSPTGSTAYALSGGGPVMHPSLKALALVPICPHTLSDRPIVVHSSSSVEIVMHSDPRTPALVSWDGQETYNLAPGDKVVVTEASRTVTLMHPNNYDYFAILRNKLHWGRSQPVDR